MLRRIWFDLVGLPPSVEQLNEYLGDVRRDRETAYARVVDRLLDSPHYGERWGRYWLDAARYTDATAKWLNSTGQAYLYRDWVVRALNDNMPFDQFLTWQLAGDLLPDTDKEKILATGFNRNHPITQEGGVIDEEYRSTYVSDRTNTLGKGILGLTFECAKCHDHKYDPFSQKDYFEVYAFFNNVNEKGIQMDAVQAKNRKYYADAPFITIEDEDLEGILSFINKPPSSSGAQLIRL